MSSFVLFFNAFLSYLLLFAVIVVLVIGACLTGVNLRRKKDAQTAALAAGDKEEA